MYLKEQFDHCINVIDRICEKYPFEKKEFYAHWLGQHYRLVQHSTRILALYNSLTPINEKVNFNHLREEIGHDAILLKDGKNLGYNLNSLLSGSASQALVSAVYGDILRGERKSCIGYILLLEGLSLLTAPKLVKRIDSALGAGKTQFLRIHIDADQDHYPNGLKTALTFSDNIKQEILRTLKYSTYLYASLLNQSREIALKNLDDQDNKEGKENEITSLLNPIFLD
jgi:hypothetical protein